MPKRFSYYASLSAKDKATYRKSDAIASVAIANPEALAPLALRIRASLENEDRRATRTASQALVDAITQALGVSGIVVSVKSKRPKDASGELHGLYTYDCDPPRIEVWMRTAEHKRVVAFKTYLRTLIHEVMHHLDLVHLGLAETFHTEGFYRRESNLVRAMLPDAFPTRRAPAAAPIVETDASTATRPPGTPKKPRRPRQLDLFG